MKTVKSVRLKNVAIDKVKQLMEVENRNFSNMVETLIIRYNNNLNKHT